MRTNFYQSTLRLALACSMLWGASAFAEDADEAEAYVEYREKIMKNLGTQSGAIGDILKHKLPYGDHILIHAKGLQAASRLVMPAFKKEAMEEGGEAKAEIWQQWDKYVAAAKKLEDASDALVAAAEKGDMKAVGVAMREVSGSCGSCHKPFRIKHSHKH
ncbi:MAG: c-type cytochrome [Candidatus Latescibacterota bacterium]|jgi:cytochrome c556